MVTLLPRHPDPSLLLEIPSQTPSRSQNLIFSTLLVCTFPVWLRKPGFQRASVSHSGFLNVLIYLPPLSNELQFCGGFHRPGLLFPTPHMLGTGSTPSGWTVSSQGGTGTFLGHLHIRSRVLGAPAAPVSAPPFFP